MELIYSLLILVQGLKQKIVCLLVELFPFYLIKLLLLQCLTFNAFV